jgi:hypothetical protein
VLKERSPVPLNVSTVPLQNVSLVALQNVSHVPLAKVLPMVECASHVL